MEHSRSWKDSRCSNTQNSLPFIKTTDIHKGVPVNPNPHYFFYTHFNIILQIYFTRNKIMKFLITQSFLTACHFTLLGLNILLCMWFSNTPTIYVPLLQHEKCFISIQNQRQNYRSEKGIAEDELQSTM